MCKAPTEKPQTKQSQPSVQAPQLRVGDLELSHQLKEVQEQGICLLWEDPGFRVIYSGAINFKDLFLSPKIYHHFKTATDIFPLSCVFKYM